MKKNCIYMILIGLMVMATGCGKSQPATANDTTVETETCDVTADEATAQNDETSDAAQNVTAQEEETAPDESAAQELVAWELGSQFDSFTFPVNFSAFYTKDFGVTAGYGGEIHYTTDSGVNWPQSANTSRCCFGIEFVNESIIYECGNGANVVKSTDGGQNFTRVGDFGGTSPNQCRMLSFSDENSGMIASAFQMGMTTDGGNSWTNILLPCKVAAIKMISPEEMYFIGDDYNLYHSVDAGNTWEPTPLNLPEQTDYFNGALAFAFSVKDQEINLFAIQKSNKTVKNYMSSDGGLTWTENAIPEVTGMTGLYLNNTESVMTANNLSKAASITLIRK